MSAINTYSFHVDSQIIMFNQYCSLRDSPHLKLYEINICTLTYILAAQERNTE